jgi:hypothetical protein
MNGPFTGDDGPSLEEAALWGDLAEMADELREARARIAELEAENARLRQAHETKTTRAQMGAAA